jgi:hypothetical protein
VCQQLSEVLEERCAEKSVQTYSENILSQTSDPLYVLRIDRLKISRLGTKSLSALYTET